MTIVDHHECTELIGQIADFGKLCDVAVHREHAIGGDHDVASASVFGFGQFGFEIVHVRICKAESFGFAQPNAVND